MNFENRSFDTARECYGLPPAKEPPAPLMEEFLKAAADPKTMVHEGGYYFEDRRHLFGYLTADQSKDFSVLKLRHPETGKEVPWSVSESIRGQGDKYNLSTGAREEAIWGIENQNGKTSYIAKIDPNTGLRTQQTGSVIEGDYLVLDFKYTFDKNGDVSSCTYEKQNTKLHTYEVEFKLEIKVE